MVKFLRRTKGEYYAIGGSSGQALTISNPRVQFSSALERSKREIVGTMRGAMSSRLEKRLSRIEQRLAKRTEEARVCICRAVTHFHGGNCLEAILKGMARVCPLHGFRDLGFFFYVAKQYPLGSEEDQFCPCPPHPWRSFLLSKSHSWAEHNVAREAWNKFPADVHFNFKEDKRRVEEAVAKYDSARLEVGRVGTASTEQR